MTPVALPGFANAHSHAVHRALRGRTHGDGGDFWTWRRVMYSVAGRLTPENYERLATAVYAEMVLAGYTVVGEFHYVHRQPDGRGYAEPTAMADALARAAVTAGIRLTLLDTVYLRGGLDEDGHELAPSGQQLRFVDATVEEWRQRHAAFRSPDPTVRRGAAVHSLRAVPPHLVPEIVAASDGEPLHVHVSEQPAENAQVRAAYGATPVALLEQAGALGRSFTAVHATHLADADIALLAAAGATACICPTTERDLADGIGPARRLLDAGAALAIGSDEHVVLDPFDELRALEGHERLATGRRGVFTSAELLTAGTIAGYRSLGWSEEEAAQDSVAVDTESPRTAGTEPGLAWLAAGAADVVDVTVAGEPVVRGGVHVRLGRRAEVGRLLADAIRALTD